MPCTRLMNRFLLAGLSLCLTTVSAQAVGILKIPEAAFTPTAGLITFSELSLDTVNPTYTPAIYGGGVDAPTVTFAGYFMGQSLGVAAPPCPTGAALSGCVVGTPSGPLSLDATAPNTFITSDGANPTSPVLSGNPTFNGPIAILFDVDLAGVGLSGGFFDAIGGTAIEAFTRTGVSLGKVTNAALGIEFLGLVTDDGSESIAGLLFSLVGSEPAGFAIDNVRFGLRDQVITPGQVPEPSTLVLLGTGFAGLAWVAQRRRRTAQAVQPS